MNLTDLKTAVPAKTPRKRVGRGDGSGTGTTAGRGHKGQYARSGAQRRAGFEGGQMPLFRRMPKKGFNNTRFAWDFAVINLDTLERYFDDGATVTVDAIKEAGIVKNVRDGVKLLGRGTVTKKLNVEVERISKTARAAIEAKGGTVKELKPPPTEEERRERVEKLKAKRERRANKTK